MVAFRAPESPLSDMADTARGPECENGAMVLISKFW